MILLDTALKARYDEVMNHSKNNKPQKNGVEIISQYVANLTSSAGVYRMISASGAVLYVGKAKNLKARVVNYTTLDKLSLRIQKMVLQTASMEFIATKTEAEALLLEANLIKSLKPRYNILLRDDKSFPYIEITSNNNSLGFCRITKHRGKKNNNSTYFGPFASAGDVNRSISELQKAFLLRGCSDSFFKSRTRPCMEYQIKRCSAPCVQKISQEEYMQLANDATDFLSGKNSFLQKNIAAKMQLASADMDYEKAAILRDRIKALNSIQAKQRVNSSIINNADLIALARKNDKFAIEIFFIRSGYTLGNKAYFPKQTDGCSENEVMEAFISSFYHKNPAPKLLIISHDIASKSLIEESLSQHNNSKITITYPLKGEKRELIERVLNNASDSLSRNITEELSNQENLVKIAQLFDINHDIKRIEIYDNSHIFGKDAVGAMVVSGEDGFIKSAYRKFNVHSGAKISGGDDYFMMEQVLTRRFNNLSDENKPDLVLIDGGAGHLTVAKNVFAKLGLHDIKFVCISKGVDRNSGREDFHISGKKPFKLPVNDPALFYLERLRDEAHRFAINAHRNKRSAKIRKSELDEISGIGAKRKKQLLNHFGSIGAIKESDIAELSKVEGINKSIATVIFNFFNPTQP